MSRPLETRILKEAAKCYGNDSPANDPMKKYGHDRLAVREIVEQLRSQGMLGVEARFGREVKSVSLDKWWTGGITSKGLEELNKRSTSVRQFNSRMLSDRDRNTMV